MARWTLLRNDRRARAEWDAGLVWFRLRYEAPEGPRRAVALLSRPESAGRVALAFAPGPPLARLHVGVPARHAATLEWMARDMAFAATEEKPDVLPTGPLAPASALPWERAFHAQIVDGCAFVDRPGVPGVYLPEPAREGTGGWTLPARPPAGLTLRPSWNGHLQPAELLDERSQDAAGWPLGRGQDGRLLYTPGPVNVYGSARGVAAWLAPLVAHLIVTKPAGLIVIDGAGDVVPVLKRKELVTRRLGQDLTYVDIDSMALGTGFNPLAPLGGETAAATFQRWQHWFAHMDVHPAGLALLADAQEEGVADIPSLQRWLEQPEQQHRPEAAHQIQAALKRLLTEPHIREWLSWPTHPFAGLPAGALLFGCTAGSLARRLVLQAALLAALQIPGARLVLHGLLWQEWPANQPSDLGRAMVTNGPLLPAATVLLAASEPPGSAILARRFLRESEWWQESLQLLDHGEGIILDNGTVTLASWKNGSTGRKTMASVDTDSLRPAAGNGG